MTQKCIVYGVGDFSSSIVYNIRIKLPLLEKNVCYAENPWESEGVTLINNRSTRGINLYKDELHLLDSGKSILVNNFKFKQLWKLSHSAPSPQTRVSLESNDFAAELQLLRNDRLMFLHNHVIGYLNVNSY